jgi:wyosine [tRNA(Phe)-imidazoG37] synthetase (radical SAM superfamily)
VPFQLERQLFFSAAEILSQVRESLDTYQPGEIDWITFVGSGETTLNAGLGEMLRGVKAMTDLPVAVITNGSLLYMPEVRDELIPADAVLPSLDAGNAQLFRKINRPHHDLTFEQLTQGLMAFRKVYSNKLWVEVMLIRGMNDHEEALREIAAWIEKIQPDEVHLVQPTRPPAETWISAPDEEGLQRAHQILGEKIKILMPASGVFDFSGEENLADAIINVITRHPISEPQLIETLSAWSPAIVSETLDHLRESGRAQIVTRDGIRFWSNSEGHYG